MSSPRIPDLPHPAQAARLLGLMLGLLVLPGCPFGPGEPPVLLPRQVDSAAEVALHLGAYRDFATRLYRHQAARQSDFVVAPLPIWLALSITVEPSLLLSEERRTVASGHGLIDPVAPFAAHAPEGRYVGNGWFTQRPHEPLGYHGPAVTTDIYPDGFREPYSGEAEQKKTVELHERVTAWLSGSAKQGLLSSVISADDFRGSTLLSAWAMRAARACSLGGEASGPSTSTPKEPVVTLARSFSLVHGVLYELSPPGCAAAILIAVPHEGHGFAELEDEAISGSIAQWRRKMNGPVGAPTWPALRLESVTQVREALFGYATDVPAQGPPCDQRACDDQRRLGTALAGATLVLDAQGIQVESAAFVTVSPSFKVGVPPQRQAPHGPSGMLVWMWDPKLDVPLAIARITR